MKYKNKLDNKRILLFAPFFFGYENLIKTKMEELGATVVLYNERAVISAFNRALLKVVPFIFKGKANQYFFNILEQHNNEKFDYILIIRCDMIERNVLKEIKRRYPKAKLCLHLWDSFNNIPGIGRKIEFFDRATSFDRDDCKRESKLIFRPLFFADEFKYKNREDKKIKYDLSFCGTIHSDRYKILKKIDFQCKEQGLIFKHFYYLQSKFIYYFYKFIKKEFKNTSISEFSFKKIGTEEIVCIQEESNVIIDIQHPKQSGLTVRTIEMLGLRKKIITTNKDIINYDFYNPVNICVIDRNNPVLDDTFFDKSYEELSDSIYQKYSLEQWIYDVLGI